MSNVLSRKYECFRVYKFSVLTTLNTTDFFMTNFLEYLQEKKKFKF